MTKWSNFLTNRIIFVLKHKLSPCLQQRLPQVYGKIYIHITGGVVMENFILYTIFICFNLVSTQNCCSKRIIISGPECRTNTIEGNS